MRYSFPRQFSQVYPSTVMLNQGLVQAIKEAKYRDLTTPRPSSRPQTSDSANKPVLNDVSSGAQSQWQRAGNIARRAGGDAYSSDEDPDAPPKEKEAKRRERDERMKTAKTMDLPYFLEMVDLRRLSVRMQRRLSRRLIR